MIGYVQKSQGWMGILSNFVGKLTWYQGRSQNWYGN